MTFGIMVVHFVLVGDSLRSSRGRSAVYLRHRLALSLLPYTPSLRWVDGHRLSILPRQGTYSRLTYQPIVSLMVIG